MFDLPSSAVVVLAGGAGGMVLGLAARLGRFCTLAAIEDSIYAGDRRRLRMWVLAMAVAISGTTLISALDLVDITRSFYHRQPVNIAAWIAGGLMFGIGMALCGTCAFGSLVRAGGGDLRAFTVCLLLGISSYMAVGGPTALLRVAIFDPLALPGDAVPWRTLIDAAGGLGGFGGWASLCVLVVAMTGWSLAAQSFRAAHVNIVWSIVVGMVIASGWLATGWVEGDPFEQQQLRSHSFSLPPGQTLIFIMTMSGGAISFAIASTLGVVAGSFAGALIRREFRWEAADDAREMRRHILGALLMGTGGVYAGGCTIGQGLTAVSVTAFSAPIVLLAIWIGAWLGLTYLMEGSVMGFLRWVLGLAQRT